MRRALSSIFIRTPACLLNQTFGRIFRMSVIGGCLQLSAWIVAWLYRDSYIGLVSAIILADIGGQCMQVSNQSGSLRQLPQATNRVNTIFMTIFFIGGSLGTFFSGLGWSLAGWTGVCVVGGLFASVSLLLSAYEHFGSFHKESV